MSKHLSLSSLTLLAYSLVQFIFLLSVFESHISSVEQLISSLNSSYTLFCGDYNIPQVSWYIGRLGSNTSGGLTPYSTHLVDWFSFLNFFELNQKLNCHAVLLDLVFSSCIKSFVDCAPTPILSPDTFPPLLITFPLNYKPRINNSRIYRDFNLNVSVFIIVQLAAQILRILYWECCCDK